LMPRSPRRRFRPVWLDMVSSECRPRCDWTFRCRCITVAVMCDAQTILIQCIKVDVADSMICY
jgi:hypothetical protein